MGAPEVVFVRLRYYYLRFVLCAMLNLFVSTPRHILRIMIITDVSHFVNC